MLRSEFKKIRIADAIFIIVEKLLPRFSPGKVLIVPVSLTADNFKKEIELRKTFKFFFTRKGNYTYVGVSISKEELPDSEELEDLAHHDSCWRTDGVEAYLEKISSEIYQECIAKDPEKGNWYVQTSFGMFGPKVVEGEIS